MSTEQFGESNFNDLKEILEEECSKYDAPLLDIYNLNKENEENNIKNNEDEEINTNIKKKKVKREINKIIRDTITAMLLCNNVTPIIDEIDKEKITYQASSPD